MIRYGEYNCLWEKNTAVGAKSDVFLKTTVEMNV
jgi:hypothetical protein